MYRKCTTEKTILQQACIEKSLFDMMDKMDYDDISVTELCRQSNISRRIFYRLYEGKDDVLFAMIDHSLLDLEKSAFSANTYDNEEMEIYYSFLRYWVEKKRLLDVLGKHHFTTLLIQRAVSFIISEEAASLSRFGINDPQRDIDTLLYHLTGMLSVIVYWHDTGYTKPIHDMAEELYRLTAALRSGK